MKKLLVAMVVALLLAGPAAAWDQQEEEEHRRRQADYMARQMGESDARRGINHPGPYVDPRSYNSYIQGHDDEMRRYPPERDPFYPGPNAR